MEAEERKRKHPKEKIGISETVIAIKFGVSKGQVKQARKGFPISALDTKKLKEFKEQRRICRKLNPDMTTAHIDRDAAKVVGIPKTQIKRYVIALSMFRK